MRRILGIVLLALAAAAPAAAQPYQPADRAGHWEFAIQTRYATSKDFEFGGGSEFHVDGDLGWGFTGSYNVSDRLNLGLVASWRSTTYDATIVGTDRITGEPKTERYSEWLDVTSIAFAGEWSFLSARVSPYVAGGIGWTALDTNVYTGTDYDCWWDWSGYVCGTVDNTYGGDAFGGSLGGGVRAEVTHAVFARAGYEHTWLNLDTLDGADVFRVDLGMVIF